MKQFGAVVQLSYYRRASNSLNSYTLPWSYYNPATNTALALTPGASVQGLDPVPDRHRWYFYDNIRERPGVFAKLEFDDHHAWASHLSFGLFEHDNDEHRYSNYLNKAGTITITSPTTGSFSQGSADADYDKYNQYRRLAYIDFGLEWRMDPLSKVSLQLNYGYGR